MSVWKEEKIFTYSIHFKTFFAVHCFGTKLLEIQHSLMILQDDLNLRRVPFEECLFLLDTNRLIVVC
jgi:hypothetical protein